ncbi:hypothetical protein NMY22_g10068 [Coprinellus aureogranulatus]|nr:hypothetical protein NMY22_g10068 [Coprinellus aureogranulatus]
MRGALTGLLADSGESLEAAPSNLPEEAGGEALTPPTGDSTSSLSECLEAAPPILLGKEAGKLAYVLLAVPSPLLFSRLVENIQIEARLELCFDASSTTGYA